MNIETLKPIFALLADVATIAGVVGVWFAVRQLRLSKQLAQSAFEDELTREYRSIVKDIPMDVLLGKPPSEERRDHVRELIYNYIDLCNQQVFLRMKGRITDDTWREWNAGMRSTLGHGFFLNVLGEIEPCGVFDELKLLKGSDFQEDPKTWRGGIQ